MIFAVLSVTVNIADKLLFYVFISYKGNEILRLSLLVFEIWRGIDTRQTRRPFHKTLTFLTTAVYVRAGGESDSNYLCTATATYKSK